MASQTSQRTIPTLNSYRKSLLNKLDKDIIPISPFEESVFPKDEAEFKRDTPRDKRDSAHINFI